MPSVQWGATAGAKLGFTPLGPALGDLSNDQGSIAILWRPVKNVARADGAQLVNSTGAASYVGLNLGDGGTGVWANDNGTAWVTGTSTPAFGDWYVSVLDWPSTAAPVRFHWIDLTTGAGWLHENSSNNDVAAFAGPGSTGIFYVGYDGDGGGVGMQIALVGVWKGVQLGDVNAVSLSARRRTSDWYNNPAGPPIFLSEITSLAPVDLVGGTPFSNVQSAFTNLTIGGDPPGGWTFDGLGAPPRHVEYAQILRRGVRNRREIAKFVQRARQRIPAAPVVVVASITGSADAAGGMGGTLLATGQMLGSADSAGTTGGQPTVVGQMAGSATGSAILAGSLQVSDFAAGSASAQGGMGLLPNVPVPTSGTMTAGGALSGTLLATAELAGTATGTSTATGTPKVSLVAACSMAGAGATSGTPRVSGVASSTMAATGTASGAMAATSPTFCAMAAVGSTSGALSSTGQIAGSAQAISSLIGAATATARASSAMTATGALSGQPLVPGPAPTSSAMSATSSLAGQPLVVARTSGAAPGVSNLAGQPTVIPQGAATFTSAAAASGSLLVSAVGASAFAVSSGLAGALSIPVVATSTMTASAGMAGLLVAFSTINYALQGVHDESDAIDIAEATDTLLLNEATDQIVVAEDR